MILAKPKIIYMLALPLLGLLFGSWKETFTHGKNHYNKQIMNIEVISRCPEENSINKKIMNSFITSPEWEQGRQETSTDHLTVSQIHLLQSPQYSATCEKFNNHYQEAISATYNDGSPEHAVTYYKVGNYYFVIISRLQPADPDFAASGVDVIQIFDDNLDFIKGYFF